MCARTARGGPADVKMNPSFDLKGLFRALRDFRGKQYFFFVQILAGQLRQLVYLPLERIVVSFVAVTEIHGGIPHLHVKIFHAVLIVQIDPLGPVENFYFSGVVDGIAIGAVF